MTDEANIGEAIETVDGVVNFIYAAIEDALKATKQVSEAEIKVIKNHLLAKNIVFKTAQLVVVAAEGDSEKILKASAGIVVGILAGLATGAVISSAVLAGIAGMFIGIAFDASLKALEDLQNQDKSDQLREWLDSDNFQQVKNFQALLTEIANSEQSAILTYKLDNNTAFTDNSIIHQQLLEQLAPVADGDDIYNIFIERENLIREFSSHKGQGIEGFILALEKIFYRQHNGVIADKAGYLARANNLLNHINSNSDQGWQLVNTAALAEAKYLNTAEGFAYRYALEHLNPIAIIGNINLYTQHNEDGELNIEHFSDQYLLDRASFLANKIRINLHKLPTSATSHPRVYRDLASNQFVTVSGTAPIVDRYTFGSNAGEEINKDGNDHLYGRGGDDTIAGGRGDDYIEGNAGKDTIIGGDGEDTIYGGSGNDIIIGDNDGETSGLTFDDTLNGSEGDDIIYGGGGSDTLIGGADDDHLYGNASGIHADILDGGSGFDTYYIQAGDGDTVIRDSDLQGRIIVDGTTLGSDIESLVGSVSSYQDKHGHHYQFTEENLVIILASGQVILVEGYRDQDKGKLGLNFANAAESSLPTTEHTIVGDYQAKLFTDEEGKQSYRYDDWGNKILDLTKPQVQDDVLRGSSVSDIVLPGGGDDTVYAKGGNDIVQGGAGRDALLGEAGADVLMGDAGSDIIWGGEENDILHADSAQTVAEALAADNGEAIRGDLLSGDDGDDIVIGNYAQDTLYGGAGSDVLIGAAGDDNLVGDTYVTSAGTDWQTVRIDEGYTFTTENYQHNITSDDVDNNDWLYGGAGDDWLSGQLGNDRLYGGLGNDVLSGGQGNDSLAGGQGDDRLFGEESDLAAQLHGSDILDGGAGDDLLHGVGGNDFLYGGAGDDELHGDASYLDGEFHGADSLAGGAGDDELIGFGSADILLGGAGDDKLYGDDSSLDSEFHGNDQLAGGADDDQLFGQGGDDELSGGSGDDFLDGGAGSDSLLGGSGADVLGGDYLSDDWSGSGNRYQGGSGADVLRGSRAGDTYIFNLGDGSDTIIEKNGLTSSDALDILQFGADISATKITVAFSGNDLRFSHANGSDQITVKDWYGNPANQLERIQFADGTVWTGAEAHQMGLQQQGTDNDDSLAGSGDNDVLRGGQGADTLLGNAGDDALYGGEGDDILDGGSGSDSFYGGSGNDTLAGMEGNGNTYQGGTGNDILWGSRYGDIYIFNLGDGADTIIEKNGLTSDDAIDRLQFGEGITSNDITATRLDTHLIFTHSNGIDKVTVQNWFGSAANRLERIEFADGTVWDGVELEQSLLTIESNDDNDTILVGTSQHDTLIGGAGNDTLDGGHGRDTLIGGAGDDILGGDYGSDDWFATVTTSVPVYGYILASPVPIPIYTIVGYDVIKGNYGNIYQGGSGNDVLQGTRAGDTYIFNLGDGKDTIIEQMGFTSSTELDILQFGEGINANDITATRSGRDVLFSHSNGTDQVRIEDWFDDEGNRLERIEFADGTVWDNAALKASLLTIYGSDGNDYLYGTSDNDTLIGLAGDDSLSGSYGDDTLDGGVGNDRLQGGRDSDTYIFALGGGVDTIIEQADSSWSSKQNLDILQFAAGITASAITVTRSATNLVFSHSNGDDQVIVQDWYQDIGKQLERIEFSDGTVWQGSQLHQDFLTIEGTENADKLIGGYANEIFKGLAGNDTLQGNEGNDTYIFALGGGVDTIIEQADSSTTQNLDILQFAPGIAASDITVTRSSANLIFSHSNGDDQVVVQDWYQEVGNQVERIEFADGTLWLGAELHQQCLTVQGSDADDRLVGGYADETLIGAGGDDSLSGAGGNDTLKGGTGDDVLSAGTGTNILEGGPGTDTLYRESGKDRYIFNLGDGVDFIVTSKDIWHTQNTDVLQFGASITPNDISLSRVGRHLIFSHQNRNDRIIVWEWFRNSFTPFKQIEFADGTVWNGTKLYQQYLNPQGTDNDDILISNAYKPGFDDEALTIKYGYAGKDETLIGGAGNDILIGGDGDDILEGGAGDDTLLGGDALTGTSGGEDILKGGAGNDILLGGKESDTLIGGSGDDILGGEYLSDDYFSLGNIYQGDSGNDILRGSRYGDTYLFNLGDGRDTIIEINGWTSDALAAKGSSYNALDTLEFGAGITANDISVTRAGIDLVFSHSNGKDQVIVQDWYGVNLGSTDLNNRLERIEFSDGSVWDGAQLQQQPLTQHASEEDDTLLVDNYGILSGLAGNDILIGQAGADTLNGDAGNDKLYGSSGDDILKGGDGNDVLDGGLGSDTLIGGAGDDLLGGNYNGLDYHSYNAGNRYQGGTSNDILRGSRYDDTYIFNLGDGLDTIIEKYAHSTDTLQFGAGINANDITLTRSGNDMLFSHSNGSDRITVKDWYIATGNQLERVEFADGSAWDGIQLDNNRLIITGSAADDILTGLADSYDDTLIGLAGDDKLNGGGGNDHLAGDEGNDTLSGGAGNDSLNGGKGNDTYIFNLGDGSDTIYDTYEQSLATVNTLQFGSGITPSDISVSHLAADLIFKHSNGVDQVIVVNWHGAGTPLQQISFADGTVWNSTQSDNSWSLTTIGTETDDILTGVANQANILIGLAGNNKLIGGDGDDVLTGGIDNDILIGGKGNDSLAGGAGTNRYIFNLGDGVDIIVAGVHKDTHTGILEFGSGINVSDITVTHAQYDLIFNHSNGTDKIILQDWYKSHYSAAGLEHVKFADGTVWDRVQIHNAGLTVISTANNHNLYGGDGKDSLNGGSGDDRLDGGAGGDSLIGGAGNDILIGDNTLLGADNSVSERDRVLYQYGHNHGWGSGIWHSGNTYQGGTGNDILYGGHFQDSYIFNLGDGSDTIIEKYAFSRDVLDALQFGAGIISSDISVIRSGNNMVFNHKNGSDQVMVQDWYISNHQQLEQIEFADGTVWDSDFTESIAIEDTTAPVLANALADHSIKEAEALSYQIASDTFSDISYLSYSAHLADGGELPAWLQFDNTTHTLTGTPGQADIGELTIRITATDRSGNSNSDDFMITVNANNTAPVVSQAMLDQTISEASSVNLLVPGATFTDNDVGDSLSYSATLANGDSLPSWLSFAAETATFTGSPDIDAAGEYRIELTATDSHGLSASTDFTLSVSDINPAIIGTHGADNLIGTPYRERLIGGHGDDTLLGGAGDDELNGGGGSDIINGGVGNDRVNAGWSGNDRILFAVGDGQDYVLSKGSDTLVFAEGIRREHITIGNDNNHIIIRLLDNAGALTGDSMTLHYGLFETEDRLPSLAFSDGSQLTGSELYSAARTVIGTSQDDVIKGCRFNDTLSGLAGADTIHGGSGDDTLLGGAGDDELNGGGGSDIINGGVGNDRVNAGWSGNDRILFAVGDGQDYVLSKGSDTLVFAEGIRREHITIGNDNNHIIIRLLDNAGVLTGDSMTLHYGLFETEDRLPSLAFSDGSQLTGSELYSAARTVIGTSQDDVIKGCRFNDTLSGLAGADTIHGGSGDDTLIGGTGNDRLQGDHGDDRYQFRGC